MSFLKLSIIKMLSDINGMSKTSKIFLALFSLLTMLPFQNCGKLGSGIVSPTTSTASGSSVDNTSAENPDSVPVVMAPPGPVAPVPGTYPVYKGCEIPSPTFLRTIYVSPLNGSDSGTGAIGSPYKTLNNVFSSQKIQPGDHIILMAGNHGSVTASKYSHTNLAASTKWTWIEGQAGAIVGSFDLRDLQRIMITDTAVTGGATSTLVSFSGGSNIVLADSDIYETKNTSSWTATNWLSGKNGLSFTDTNCASVLRNKITNVRFAATFASSVKLPPENRINTLVQSNSIKNYSGDGMRPLGSNISLINNSIVDCYLNEADGDANHDDAIQGFALGGAIYENIDIVGTYVQESTDPKRAFNASTQGISVFDGLYRNIYIAHNIVIVSAWHGIAMYGVENAVIENNIAIPSDPAINVWILTPPSKGGVSSKNVILRNNMAMLLEKASAGISVSNNVTLTNNSLPSTFVLYNLGAMNFDLHLKTSSPYFGQNIGAY